jgi:DNA-binding XRE family transcriptional regulator
MTKSNDEISPFEWTKRGFLARLKEERERSAFTVEDMASHLNLTRSSYRSIEAGDTTITLDIIVRLPGMPFDIQFLFTGVRSLNVADAIIGMVPASARDTWKAKSQ